MSSLACSEFLETLSPGPLIFILIEATLPSKHYTVIKELLSERNFFLYFLFTWMCLADGAEAVCKTLGKFGGVLFVCLFSG